MTIRGSVEAGFDEAAPEYDAWVRQAIPGYEAIFSLAVEWIAAPRDRAPRCADLGAVSKHTFLAVLVGLKSAEPSSPRASR